MIALTMEIVLGMVFLMCALRAEPGKGRPERPGGGRGTMPNIDANGDGEIDEAEAGQAAANRIEGVRRQLAKIKERFDENGDGTLGEDEIAKLTDKMGMDRRLAAQKQMLGMVDTDGDWSISEAEEKAAAEKLSEMLAKGGQANERDPRRQRGPSNPDANGDCIIDNEEAAAAATQELDRMKMMIERMKERFADNPDAQFPGRLAEIDKNKDWALDEAEAEEFLKQRAASIQERNARVLKVFDNDKDGKLSETEIVAVKKAFEFMEEERNSQMSRMREGMRGRQGQRGQGQRGRGGDQGGGRAGRRPEAPPK